LSSSPKPSGAPQASRTLIDVWRKQPEFIESKSFRQIIQLAGDGRLRDGSHASAELREWLAAVPLDHLRSCVEECLADSFSESGHALQDGINELGTRLGFAVTSGRYRGVRGEIGFDGLWLGKDGFGFLVEIKTTDAYRINLDTIANYRDQLVAEGTLQAQQSSILIAVGRQDTGDLEAQIRGSRHAWDVRLISLDAIVRLAEVKEELNDRATSNKINQLLRPVEYTRLDAIVELLFAAKKDLETRQEAAPPPELTTAKVVKAGVVDGVDKARALAIARIAKTLNWRAVRRRRALAESDDGSARLVCLASKQYEGPAGSNKYWYGFTVAQREYLDQAEIGWLGLAVESSDRAFLVPWKDLRTWLPELLTTPPAPTDIKEVRHWHLYINDYGAHVDLTRSGGGVLCDLNSFLLRD
jgi:hypothetical protein